MQLQDRVALVTGAGRGIGKAIALRFAREGADVGVFDLDEASARSTADEITALGRRAVHRAVDVADGEQVQAAVGQVADELGRLDICVNNAGFAKAQPFLEMTHENWDRHLKVHLYGSFFCAQAAAREMVRRRFGRIVNIASVAGLMGPIDLAAYGAAKSGVIGMTRAAALELADHGITVNAIAPGPIETELLRVWSAEALRERAKHQPVARLGAVEEIAHAALFLASAESGYINGTTLVIDGGAVGAGAYMVEKYRRRKAGA
ncbi:MAG: 3-oxoacyl-acyl-carrier protein reductase [Panacagrimonas sp.]|nr:SDR family NAD(P)-dependent oxidoreductase [Panacagrimonas sp.]MCC2658764.1 3-oxoacyl-acyl-carrier protein reductase [Panacagrimonas sp.]